jgi:hypothetical protein
LNLRRIDMDIKLGCDPEVFVKKNGVFHSAYGMCSGTKAHPLPCPDGGLQVDGMALEFNVTPCDTGDEFVSRIKSVLGSLQDIVPGYELSITPVAMFDQSHFDSQPEQARELGCDPDWNAWTGAENPRPDNTTTMRTAGGHIHVGWCDPTQPQAYGHQDMAQALIKQLDFYLGLPSLVFDTDTKRRAMYGKAGAYRVKPYGVEYRTLSNQWIATEGLIRWADRATRKAVADLESGVFLPDTYGDIQEIINTSNLKEAQKIIRKANLDTEFNYA